MKIGDVMVCLDCDEVFGLRLSGPPGHVASIRGECPRCGSMAIWPLGRWIPGNGDKLIPQSGHRCMKR